MSYTEEREFRIQASHHSLRDRTGRNQNLKLTFLMNCQLFSKVATPTVFKVATYHNQRESMWYKEDSVQPPPAKVKITLIAIRRSIGWRRN